MKSICTFGLVSIVTLSFFLGANAQGNNSSHEEGQYKHTSFELDIGTSLDSRVGDTPNAILERFRSAGMDPTRHLLTEEELEIVDDALEKLPPLHKAVLKKRLFRISFLNNMPNTALTAPVNPKDSLKLYSITIRAEILHQSASEWLTEKELSVFSYSQANINLSIDAGNLDALVYVLVHEATHIVDGTLGLLPSYTVSEEEENSLIQTNFFAKEVWLSRLTPKSNFSNDLLDRVYFRTRKKMPIEQAEDVYSALKKSPFVSLYARNSYHEDLAEMLTIYHFTKVLGQPFKLTLRKDDVEILSYEPMNSELIKDRTYKMSRFYKTAHRY